MKKPWFKAKQYGWGWGLPMTWQGWVIFIAYLAFIVFAAIRSAMSNPHAASHFLIVYISQVLFASLVLLVIVYVTGEKPKWRWGKK